MPEPPFSPVTPRELEWARQCGLKNEANAVFAWLASQRNIQTFSAIQSDERISRFLAFKEGWKHNSRTVGRIKDRLKDSGALKRIEGGNGGRGRATEYTFYTDSEIRDLLENTRSIAGVIRGQESETPAFADEQPPRILTETPAYVDGNPRADAGRKELQTFKENPPKDTDPGKLVWLPTVGESVPCPAYRK